MVGSSAASSAYRKFQVHLCCMRACSNLFSSKDLQPFWISQIHILRLYIYLQSSFLTEQLVLIFLVNLMYINIRNKLRVLQRERPPPFQVKYLNKQTLLLVKRMIFQRAKYTETESILGFYSSAIGDCVFFPLAGVQLKSY